MSKNRNLTSSSKEDFSEDGWLSWTVEDFYGTTVLCEQNPNGSITSSVVVNDTFSVPNDQYQSWCIDDENNDEYSLGFCISSFFIPAVGILCNSIVCLVLVKGRRFKRNFSIFHIFNLALTDLFFRCCFAPVLLEVVNRSLLTSWSCKLLSFLNFSTLAVTFTLPAGIAVDRYLNISFQRYFVNTNTLVSLYYALIYPLFIYSLIAWGNTYESNVRPLFLLQKRAIRIITFSSFTEHTSPIFKSLNIVKCFDIVKLITSVFMYKFHRKLLPSIFSNFFTPVRNVHNYNTRLASKSSFVLPSARTNYRIFSLKFQGPKTWNSIDESLKSCSISAF